MTPGQSDLPDDDKRWDRLVMEAGSDYSLAPDRPEKKYDAVESDRQAYRHWRRKHLVAVSAAIIVGGGLLGYLIYGYWQRASEERRVALAAEEEQARLTVAAQETTSRVKRFLEENNFGDARHALEFARQKGIPSEAQAELDTRINQAVIRHATAEIRRFIAEESFDEASRARRLAGQQGLPIEAWGELDAEIEKAARACRAGLLDRAEREIARQSSETAREFMAAAGQLDQYAADDQRSVKLEEALNRLAHQQKRDSWRKILARSRQAAAEKDWDQAIALLEQVRQEAHGDPELAAWNTELGDTVGGRLRIVGRPAGATVHIAGRGSVRLGKVLDGIPPGIVAAVVKAGGYIPERVRVDIPRFPGIGEATVDLTPAAPGPLWATHVLAGHCAQLLAARYYRRTYEDADWADSLREISEPCNPPPTEKKEKPRSSKKDFAAQVRAAEDGFRAERDNPFAALNRLGQFTARHPKSLKTILATCAEKIGRDLGAIEQGCGDCFGQGNTPCPECGGRGQREERRTCPTCQGRKRVSHQECNGTGIAKCKKCKGSGRITRMKRVRRGDEWTIEPQPVPCPSCEGDGQVICRCRDGLAACPDCKVSGKRKMMGPCSACTARGHLPCDLCQTTGRRDDMDPVKRRAIENTLASLFKPES
jgi:hypothetical protein